LRMDNLVSVIIRDSVEYGGAKRWENEALRGHANISRERELRAKLQHPDSTFWKDPAEWSP